MLSIYIIHTETYTHIYIQVYSRNRTIYKGATGKRYASCDPKSMLIAIILFQVPLASCKDAHKQQLVHLYAKAELKPRQRYWLVPDLLFSLQPTKHSDFGKI